jgi:hypothetical protein
MPMRRLMLIATCLTPGIVEAQEPRRPAAATQRCSVASRPVAETRALEAEFARRMRAEGQAAATRWAREEGYRYRQKLVAQGVCPPLPGERTASAPAPAKKPLPGKKRGGKCTKTVMQARNIANPGGSAMSMIMVPVCVN